MFKQMIGVADLQRRAKDVLAQARKLRQPFLVTAHNKPQAVLLGVGYYEDLQKELTRYREEERMVKKVRKAEAEVARGKALSGDLETLLRRI